LKVQQETPESARELLREQGLFTSTDHISGGLERLIMDAFVEDDDDGDGYLHMITLRQAERPSFALGAVFWRELATQEMFEWISPSGVCTPTAREIARTPSDERWTSLRARMREIIEMSTLSTGTSESEQHNQALNTPQSTAATAAAAASASASMSDEVDDGYGLFDNWIKIELVVTHVDHLGERIGTVLLSLALTHAAVPTSAGSAIQSDVANGYRDARERVEDDGAGCEERTQHAATHAILHAAGGEANVPAVRLCK
jgi:hypothetical protein